MAPQGPAAGQLMLLEPPALQPQATSRRRGLPEPRRLWWRIWCGAPGIGWQRLQHLQSHFGSLERAWAAGAGELSAALAGPTRMGVRAIAALEHYRREVGPDPLTTPITPDQRRRWHASGVLMPGDGSLPESLLALERPPLALHWRGRGSLWPALRERQAVAVVGTRRPSRHGEAMARAIGRALAEAGWPVVSGLAEGIDAAAHQGCLEAGGRPVAILGTPLERVYPRHHTALQAEVGRQGLLVSELPEGSPVRAGHFAARNRLQVALAGAVVLVECPQQSGALHSAELAWHEQLPLWVVPADAGRVSAAGSNRLLARGATALVDPADLIHQLGPGPLRRQPPQRGSALLQREAALLGALGAGASLEQLCQRLRLPPGVVSTRLLQLELAGLVQAEPSLWWRPTPEVPS